MDFLDSKLLEIETNYDNLRGEAVRNTNTLNSLKNTQDDIKGERIKRINNLIGHLKKIYQGQLSIAPYY